MNEPRKKPKNTGAATASAEITSIRIRPIRTPKPEMISTMQISGSSSR